MIAKIDWARNEIQIILRNFREGSITNSFPILPAVVIQKFPLQTWAFSPLLESDCSEFEKCSSSPRCNSGEVMQPHWTSEKWDQTFRFVYSSLYASYHTTSSTPFHLHEWPNWDNKNIWSPIMDWIVSPKFTCCSPNPSTRAYDSIWK